MTSDSDQSSLDGIRGLQQDLIALSKSQLQNVDRLWEKLDASVEEFKRLLNKPQKNENSRRGLHSGNITIHDVEYAVNKEFQESAIQVAEGLDLDELESARLLLEAQKNQEVLGTSLPVSAVFYFHEYRTRLLDCLRLALSTATNLETHEETRSVIRDLIGLILGTKDGVARNGSLYIRQCMDYMADIEKWTQALADRLQGTLALGQPIDPEFSEAMAFQQQSLGEQHETLGAIIFLLVKMTYSTVDDFLKILDHMPKLTRWNALALHYIPIITVFCAEYGSSDGNGSFRDARILNRRILDNKANAKWSLRGFQAAMVTWWLAEYSGRYTEPPTGSPLQGVNLEDEARERSAAFFEALEDGAFQCTLSICSQVVPFEWYDPSRTGLIEFLLRDASYLPQDLGVPPEYFQEMIMEQFETFADALITNMPDTLRRFKSEDDGKRKDIFSKLPAASRAGTFDQESLHLERFLVIVSFAFEDRVEAAQAFWGDVDSNLYGFLQWASKRQSTPFVGPFCEMLRSISKGEEAASSAHQFLLEQGSVGNSKIRRASSLSWAQILGELKLYIAKLREPPQTTRTSSSFDLKQGDDYIDEPESVIMLQTYLRLMAHICAESTVARTWILSQTDPNVIDLIFYLCNTAVPSRLQACAFSVIQSLLTAKSPDVNATIWTYLDRWLSGAYNPPPNVSRPSMTLDVGAPTEEVMLTVVASDFEQTNNFVSLLQSLIRPAEQDPLLNDHLPFPENLGQAYRMPGIEPFVDFVLEKAFSAIFQKDRILEKRVLSWNVLDFVVTALATFNENLVILGNKSTTAVDEAITTSSLLAYVRLHPFARVMEWMFNEKVLGALFAVTHQQIDDLSYASPDSPLMHGLIRGIETMNLIMDMQSIYLDLVRPLLKKESTGRKPSVMSSSLASFDDSVSMHLDLIVDLGLYASIGNQDLAVSSLKLLEKLSSSRKLNVQPSPGSKEYMYGNRLIGALEQNHDLERIERSFSMNLEFDQRELELGPTSPAWTIKSIMLDFLVNCLSTFSERPTIAHALLGFACHGPSVHVEPNSPFENGSSLFHAVLHLVQEYPDSVGNDLQLWAISLRRKAMDVLSLLWTSPLTSVIVIAELRARQFLFTLFSQQRLLDHNTVWDGRMLNDGDFSFTDSAETLQQALRHRHLFLKYAAIEERLVIAQNIPSLRTRIFRACLGSAEFTDGEQITNASIFDLFDFVELVTVSTIPTPKYQYFKGVDFDVSIEEEPNIFGVSHNLKLVDELINLRLNDIKRTGGLNDPAELQKVDDEAMQIVSFFLTENNQQQFRIVRQHTLVAWADLITVTVASCEPDQADKGALILQVFQLITPKLEYFVSVNAPEALVIARLIQSLLFELDLKSTALDQSRAGGVASDRLFHVYSAALRAISSPGLSLPLREVLYGICHRYLSSMSDTSSGPAHHRSGIKTVKLAGERMTDIICDDAYGASQTCRIAAIILLDSLAELSISDGSDYIINSLVRKNFLEILIESIQTMPKDLHDTPAHDIPLLLVYYSWKLSLLLTISRSKLGATLLVNAGLFTAIRASGLFSVDPDIGIEIDNPEALAQYYRLLLAVTRIVTSVTLSKGPQNDTMIVLARGFLLENRALLVAVFKRDAKIGGVSFDDKGGSGGSVEELVELFGVLIEMTGFLEYEEEQDNTRAKKLGFS